MKNMWRRLIVIVMIFSAVLWVVFASKKKPEKPHELAQTYQFAPDTNNKPLALSQLGKRAKDMDDAEKQKIATLFNKKNAASFKEMV